MQRSERTLLASAARTADGTGAGVEDLGFWDRGTFVLDVTAAATEGTDTLNVFVQCSFDGSTWFDVAAFPQCYGNGGAKRYLLRGTGAGTFSPPRHEMTDRKMLAGSAIPCPAPEQLRVAWDVNDPSGSNLSFTFSVKAYLEGD